MVVVRAQQYVGADSGWCERPPSKQIHQEYTMKIILDPGDWEAMKGFFWGWLTGILMLSMLWIASTGVFS